MMSGYKILLKKRNGECLSEEEIRFLIESYVNGEFPDYQMSAFLMAVFFNGLNNKETFYLTKAMMESGDLYDLSEFGEKCVDKHSTGGVGDKVSLICGPIVSSLGVKVPMICGKGLGHTGGTVDKLESISGMKLDLSRKKFFSLLRKIGIVFSSQTDNFAPADKKLYSLRDVTGTVENISLITASIMSKKLAGGAPAIVFDVKTGKGAFLEKMNESKELAKMLISVAKSFGRKSVAVITDMNEPLGFCVGNMIEVLESIEALKGNGATDLMEVSLEISSWMLVLAGVARNEKEGIKLAERQINNGKALEKFKELIHAQGGKMKFLKKENPFENVKNVIGVFSEKDGYIHEINGKKIGDFCTYIGAGRQKLDDKIDYLAGVVLFKKTGDRVKKGDLLARVYSNRPIKPYVELLSDAYLIKKRPIKRNKKVLAIVR